MAVSKFVEGGVYYGFWPGGAEERIAQSVANIAAISLPSGTAISVEVHPPGCHGCGDPLRQRGEAHWQTPPKAAGGYKFLFAFTV